LKKLDGSDAILCMLTTNLSSKHAIKISQKDVKQGTLKKECNVRPDRLFTADTETFIDKVCTLNDVKMEEILQQVTSLFS